VKLVQYLRITPIVHRTHQAVLCAVGCFAVLVLVFIACSSVVPSVVPHVKKAINSATMMRIVPSIVPGLKINSATMMRTRMKQFRSLLLQVVSTVAVALLTVPNSSLVVKGILPLVIFILDVTAAQR